MLDKIMNNSGLISLKVRQYFPSIFIVFVFSVFAINAKGQIVNNGDMELGTNGLNTVPAGWVIVSGTPDFCDSSPETCQTIPYKIQTPSPQGGNWVRFFNGLIPTGLNNEVFGQTLTSPLISEQKYEISFYASYSKVKEGEVPTTASVLLGFSNGVPVGQVGANNQDILTMTTPEEWVYHTFTFTPSIDLNFLSFGKLEEDLVNACYIDDVKIEPICQVDLGPDTTVCDDKPYILDATTKNGVYLWQDGSTEGTFEVTEPGTYWVEVSANLCTSRDTIVVNFKPAPVLEIENEVNSCIGSTYELDATYPNATYLWQDGSTDPVLEVTEDGFYDVEVTVNGCTANEIIEVIFNGPPVVDIGPDTTLCEGDQMVLDPDIDNAEYKWQDGATVSRYLVSSPGIYVVEVDRYGCIVSDTINITLQDQYCDCFFAYPNVFSPNDDGVNDNFEVFNTCPVLDFKYVVFNRWGAKMFESNNLGEFWDGKFNGQPAETGVYVFYLEYQFFNSSEKESLSGSFTLLR